MNFFKKQVLLVCHIFFFFQLFQNYRNITRIIILSTVHPDSPVVDILPHLLYLSVYLSLNSFGGIILNHLRVRYGHETPLPLNSSVHIFEKHTFFYIPVVCHQNQEIAQGSFSWWIGKPLYPRIQWNTTQKWKRSELLIP